MRKVFLYIFLFLFGITLSVVFFYHGRLDTFVSKLAIGTNEDSTSLIDSSKSTADSYHPLIPRNLSSEDVTKLLVTALRTGTLESLQTYRTEFLKRIPNFNTTIRPVIEEEAIKNLIRRFEDIDWIDWPSASFGKNGGPTRARAYVDDITAVNKSLGRLLETSAQIFHDLYVNTARGQVYSLERGLVEIVGNAEQLLQYRKSVAVPARERFDLSVKDNPVFLRTLEKLRAKLVAAYVNRYTDDIDVQLNLVNSLQIEYADSVVFDAVSLLVYRLSLQTSVKFRDNVFSSYSMMFEGLAEADPSLQRAIGELYLVRATDLLEVGEKDQAEEFYEKAILYDANPSLRRLLGEYMASASAASDNIEREAITIKGSETKRGLFGRRNRVNGHNEESSATPVVDFSFLFILMVVLIALGFGFGLIYFYRVRVGSRSYQRDIDTSEPLISTEFLSADGPRKHAINAESENSEIYSELLPPKEKSVVTPIAPLRKVVNSRS